MRLLLLTRKIRIASPPEQELILWDLPQKCHHTHNFTQPEWRLHWEANHTKPPAERTPITYPYSHAGIVHTLHEGVLEKYRGNHW